MECGSCLHGVGLGCLVCLLILALGTLFTSADTLPNEASALVGVASNWQNIPSTWAGEDPCSSHWDGVKCSNSHIISITLSNLGISGILSEEIEGLPELVHLELSYNADLNGPIPHSIGNLVKLQKLILVGCGFSGNIPPELGRLSSLSFLSLNSNHLRGPIPGALGNLSSVHWLDITDNMISGSIPVSDGTNLGLDMLTNCQHFHFGKNNLSGPIPPSLFHSEMKLLHVILDNNHLSGSIPTTIGLMRTLEAVRLDGNELSGNVPPNLNNLTRLVDLRLSNNQLTGPLPNLTGIDGLTYLDMSNNSFDESEVPSWFSTSQSLTTIILEHLSISGQIPTSLFVSPLQTARLRNNRFNGTLDLSGQIGSQLSLVDLQHNNIQKIKTGNYLQELILVDNPYCEEGESESKYCTIPQQSSDTMYSTTPPNCGNSLCPPDQDMDSHCYCSYPYTGTIFFWLQNFSDIKSSSHYLSLETSLYKIFLEYQVPVSSVSVLKPHMNNYGYLQISLKFFPARKVYFDESEVFLISSLFNNQNFTAPPEFGPYYFRSQQYIFQVSSSGTVPGSKSKKGPPVIGATVGVIVLLSAIICLLILHKKRKAKEAASRFQFSGLWNLSTSSSSIPQLTGPRIFSLEEIRKCTKNFSEENCIGSGAYGKVYRGVLADGQVVAVKRAQQGSAQGNQEFKTEIEMLSRVHHKNLVSLVGLCIDHNEEIVVYEYVPNGTLRESLSGKSGIRMDWKRRLRVAHGAASGLAYLHELANPPIIHRDIKSNNILLDHRLNAKVSDFGLSRTLFDDAKHHITTQVKGTVGYLDPEYYMTQQLTEKSDVYSFGVLLLELVTARKPIEEGQYVVRQVKDAIDKQKNLLNLDELLDPTIATVSALRGLENFIDLAMKCVEDESRDRPSMSEVVKEIENIMQVVDVNSTAESGSTSPPFAGKSGGGLAGTGEDFEYSSDPFSPRTESK
ncbi:leucine-rich repeat receptor protein kinase HPCA1-like isoform X2 [Musa acuminata AAA Group]|uniref:leucine-rich repeat receptor protein kinase HPCA1-like isoform X2 n=1 Tax=Musa acuminata AAA Group TaxID=214697 RepID=UPI0031D85B71